MSVTVSKGQAICNDACNHSPSKQLWTFTKTRRFHKYPAYNNNLCYEKGGAFEKASTGPGTKKGTFGTSKRQHLFVNKEISIRPSPSSYMIGSNFAELQYAFEKPRKAMRPFTAESKSVTSFGAGREKYAKVVSTNGTNYMPYDPQDPGPGYYRSETYTNTDPKAIGFPMYYKPEIFNIKPVPGPGAYQAPTELAQNQRQYVSKFQRTATPGVIKAPVSGEDRSTKHDRVPFHGNLRPGPADYSKSHLTDMMGRFNGKFSRLGKSAHSNQFGRQHRITTFSQASSTESPGPGAYRESSAFGHYMSKTAFYENAALATGESKFSNNMQSTAQSHRSGSASRFTGLRKKSLPETRSTTDMQIVRNGQLEYKKMQGEDQRSRQQLKGSALTDVNEQNAPYANKASVKIVRQKGSGHNIHSVSSGELVQVSTTVASEAGAAGPSSQGNKLKSPTVIAQKAQMMKKK